MARLVLDEGQYSSQPEADPNIPSYVGTLSPKDQAAWKDKQYQDGVKRLNDLREQLNQGESVLSDLNRFGELNRDTGTGGFASRYASPIRGYLDPNFSEMQSIQSRLGPRQRVQGSGSSSDRDVSLFMKGLPSTDNTGNANKNVRLDYQRQFEHGLAKQKFLQDYLTKYGHLIGADNAFMSTPDYKNYIQGQNPSSPSDSGGWSATIVPKGKK